MAPWQLQLVLLSLAATQLCSAKSAVSTYEMGGSCPNSSFTKPPAARNVNKIFCASLCQRKPDCIAIQHSPSGDCTHITLDEYESHWSSNTSCSEVTYLKRNDTKPITPTTQLLLANCKQSSTETTWGNAVCGRAIDNNTNPVWEGDSCTGTLSERNAWWQAEFAANALVASIKIYNRDMFQRRLGDFKISVDGEVCAEFKSSTYFSIKEFPCGAVGRTIRVQSRYFQEALTICELVVFGSFV